MVRSLIAVFKYLLCNSNNSNNVKGGPGQQWTSYCNTFDLLLGIIVYNTNDVMTVFSMVAQQNAFNLGESGESGAITLNSAAYNATYATIASTSPDANVLIQSSSWRNEAFEFCTLSSNANTSCSMFALNLYDTHDFTVSEYSFQLLNASCTNSLAISTAAWAQLKAVPPTTLTQAYYKCTEQQYVALFNAVGNHIKISLCETS